MEFRGDQNLRTPASARRTAKRAKRVVGNVALTDGPAEDATDDGEGVPPRRLGPRSAPGPRLDFFRLELGRILLTELLQERLQDAIVGRERRGLDRRPDAGDERRDDGSRR